MNRKTAHLTWDENGLPHSLLFDDKYFCKENGYEETMLVSCEGNQLANRFRKLNPADQGIFTIIETGFGTGLNFCCAWKVWRENAPLSWTMHFISVEKFPLTSHDLSRALRLWEPLNEFSMILEEKYQPQTEGCREIVVDEGRVKLSIVFDDVLKALDTVDEMGLAPLGACAWFLDGFAPSKNPLMWSDDVFRRMAKLSAPHTTLATFTVAGFVRRGLEANGFNVSKIKGYGLKKNYLVGSYSKRPLWGGDGI